MLPNILQGKILPPKQRINQPQILIVQRMRNCGRVIKSRFVLKELDRESEFREQAEQIEITLRPSKKLSS